jgi:hypothetical protein
MALSVYGWLFFFFDTPIDHTKGIELKLTACPIAAKHSDSFPRYGLAN